MMRCLPMLVAGLMLGSAAEVCADVGLIKIDGAIGPATASYIARAVDVSGARNDACLIIQLDTPGGLLDSTKQIVQKLYASTVPTVVYVAPSEAIAEKRGRNVEWAKSSVRESASITAEKALDLKVIEIIAKDLPDLLNQLDGREINGKTLKTSGANVIEIPM